MKIEKIIYISIILLLGLLLLFKSCDKPKPYFRDVKPTFTKIIEQYRDTIADMKDKINVINEEVNRLNSDLVNVRLQKEDIEKKYRKSLTKIRSVVPEKCDTVFVTYDEFIDSLEVVHSLEVKSLEQIIISKDSIILYQENIINSHEEVEDALQGIIYQQEKDKKEFKKKKNRQIVIGTLGGFVAGIITSIFI